MPPPVPPSEALLKHAGFVRALAFAALRGDAESEDLAQDAWVAALQHAPAEPSRQRSWFVRVVKNRAAELLRVRGRRDRRERVAAERRRAPASTDDLAEQAETGRRLVGAVLALDEPFRSAILLRFHEDLPPREVAERLGVPVETARSRVRRGLERLRVSMSQGARAHGSDWRAALVPLVPGGARSGTSIASAGALAAGGVVVKKFAIAALLLVLVGGGAWFVWGSGGRSDDESEAQLLTAHAPPAAGGAAEPLAGGPSLEGSPAAARVGGPPAPSATPSVTAAAFRGIVVDEAGKPVPGAVVEVVENRSHDLLGAHVDAPEPTPNRFKPQTADAEGRFAIVEPENSWSGGLNLRATAPGRVPKESQGYVFAQRGQEVRLRLVAGVLVSIEVVDAERGAPVAGAVVEVHSGGGYVLYGSEPIEQTPSDARGRAQLTVAPGQVSFVARAPGKGVAVARDIDLTLSTHDLRLALRAAGSVEGTVLLPDGRPAVGAQVLMLRYPSERRYTTSDAAGRIRFDDVPSDDPQAVESEGQRVLVFLTTADSGRFSSQGFSADPPPPGGVRTVRLQLAEKRTLVGTLRRPDGTPAVGVTWSYGLETGSVEWGWTAQHWNSGKPTGPEGQFRLADLPPGRVLLAFGNADQMNPSASVLVPVDADPAPLDVILEDEPRRVSVLVLDTDGRPVPDAQLRLVGPNVGGRSPSATTSRDGTAQLALRGLPPWEVVAEPARLAPAFAAVPANSRSDPAKPDVVVRLGGGVLEGRVLHLDGRPAVAQLHLALPGRTGLRSIESTGRIGSRSSTADGRFQFPGVSQGAYGLRSASMGLRVVEEGAEFRAGQGAIEIHVATAAEAIALTLAVEVVDATDGRGLTTGVLLEARPAAGGSAISFTPDVSAGMFTAARLAQPGTWTVRASRDGYEPAETTVEVGATAAVPRLRLALRRR